jgi:hypothetical protein
MTTQADAEINIKSVKGMFVGENATVDIQQGCISIKSGGTYYEIYTVGDQGIEVTTYDSAGDLMSVSIVEGRVKVNSGMDSSYSIVNAKDALWLEEE